MGVLIILNDDNLLSVFGKITDFKYFRVFMHSLKSSFTLFFNRSLENEFHSLYYWHTE
jgi:hypothetical protein